MGWEERERGSQLYYTRSRKINGRVVREYVGGGPAGALAALVDAEERRQREEARAAWMKERERLEELAGLIDEFCEDVEVITRSALIAAGFRRHKRGQWRRKREPRTATGEQAGIAALRGSTGRVSTRTRPLHGDQRGSKDTGRYS